MGAEYCVPPIIDVSLFLFIFQHNAINFYKFLHNGKKVKSV